MPENPHYGEEIVNPETHHEESDVNVRALILFAVVFIAFAVVAHLVLVLMYKTYVKIENRRNTSQMTGIERTPEMSRPQNQPLLQPFPRAAAATEQPPYQSTPVTDLGDMRANEDKVLHSYGWIDRQKGVVRIPIEVAMRVAVQRGLPMQQTTTTQPAPRSTMPQNIPDTGAHP
jgi:hypothetical protein